MHDRLKSRFRASTAERDGLLSKDKRALPDHFRISPLQQGRELREHGDLEKADVLAILKLEYVKDFDVPGKFYIPPRGIPFSEKDPDNPGE